jgi:hypothetical protein
MPKSKEEIVDYLKTHPLYLEILSVLAEKKRITPTSLANLLGRKSVSTIFEPLKYMREELKILKSEKYGKNTYFHPVDIKEIKELIEMRELREAFLRVKSKLSTKPLFIERKFYEELVKELIKQEKTMRVTGTIKGILGESKLDFVSGIFPKKGVMQEKVAIKIKHVYYPFVHTNPFYEIIGEIINIIKSPVTNVHHFSGLLTVIIFLPSGIPTVRTRVMEIDKWKLQELVQSLSTKAIKTDLLLQQAGEDDLTNPLYIKKLAEEILINAKKLIA